MLQGLLVRLLITVEVTWKFLEVLLTVWVHGSLIFTLDGTGIPLRVNRGPLGGTGFTHTRWSLTTKATLAGLSAELTIVDAPKCSPRERLQAPSTN